jgi:hypothetical protein
MSSLWSGAVEEEYQDRVLSSIDLHNIGSDSHDKLQFFLDLLEGDEPTT